MKSKFSLETPSVKASESRKLSFYHHAVRLDSVRHDIARAVSKGYFFVKILKAASLRTINVLKDEGYRIHAKVYECDKYFVADEAGEVHLFTITVSWARRQNSQPEGEKQKKKRKADV